MKAHLLLLFGLCSVLTLGRDTETLIFDDEFDDFDLAKWQHEITLGGGGNWEFEMYWNNRSNSYVKDGVLYIHPTLTADRIGENFVRAGFTQDLWGGEPGNQCTSNAWYGCLRTSGAGGNFLNPIQSARLRTVNSFAFKYGRVEFRAKIPVGHWLWPALWLLPKHQAYGNWPASGEIDVMESRGNIGYPAEHDGGPESFGSTLHFGPSWDQDGWSKTHAVYKKPSGLLSDEFHTYGLIWTKDYMRTYIDDETNVVLNVDTSKEDFWTRGGFAGVDNPWQYSKNKNAPYDQEFYIIMNVAVGGVSGYFPDGVAGKPWANGDPHSVNAFYNAKGEWYPTWVGDNAALKVDSVKVWKLAEETKPEKFMEA